MLIHTKALQIDDEPAPLLKYYKASIERFVQFYIPRKTSWILASYIDERISDEHNRMKPLRTDNCMNAGPSGVDNVASSVISNPTNQKTPMHLKFWGLCRDSLK